MSKSLQQLLALSLTVFLTGGWGVRGHQVSNRVAIQSLPSDAPEFLRANIDWIAATGPLPDSWRGNTEPYAKLFEDPNHGWFKEQFSFLKNIPRSRYEFTLALYDEYLRIKDKDPERAALMNIRWTGTLPYAAMENYDRMKSAFRLWRQAKAAKQDTTFLERDIAFYIGWTGHYTADGANPMHNTIHHDGWLGANPKGYATDSAVHGRFETRFVDLIELSDGDLKPFVKEATVLADPFAAIVAHLDDAYAHLEEVYGMDKRGAFAVKEDKPAREMVYQQLAKSSTLLRDLTWTAWIESGKPMPGPGAPGANDSRATSNPISSKNPLYNPATGTAPPPGAPVLNKR